MSLADLFGIGGDGGATNTQRQALAEFDKIGIPDPEKMKIQLQKMVQQGILTPEQAQTYQQAKTGMSDITTDPNNMNAAKTALSGLTDVYQQGGLNDSDKAALGDIQDSEAQAEKGSRGAIMQNMQERGAGGSGLELAAQLSSQQNASQAKATADRDIAGQAQSRALQAMQAAGGLGQSLQGQEFGQKAQVATAQDAINKFNTQNSQDVQNKIIADRNAAQAANLGVKQGIADTNVGLGNEQEVANKGLIQGNFNNKMNLAGGKAGIYNNIAGIQQGQQKSKDAFTGSLIGAAANVGAAMINPYAAVAKVAKKAIAPAGSPDNPYGQSRGGRIPGRPVTHGDSEMNDTVPAKLSPGEIVVPRSIAKNPARAADFVKHPPMAKSSIHPEVLKMIMKKYGMAPKMATGGRVLDVNQTPADKLNPNIEAIMASMNGMQDESPQGIPAISADQPDNAQTPALAPAPMPISPAQSLPAAPAPQDDFSPEARQDMLANMGKPNVGKLIAMGVGGIGDAMSASVGQTGKGMSGVEGITNSQKQGAIDKFAAGREDVGYQAKIGQQKEMMDPASETSKIYQSFVKQMTGKDTTLPANEIADLLPITVKMYDAKLAAQARTDAADTAANARIEAAKEGEKNRENLRNISLGQKDDQWTETQWQKLTGTVNALNAGSRRALGVAATNNMRADRLLQTANNKFATSQDISNIVSDIQAIYKGGVPDELSMKHGDYNTFNRKLSETLTYITSNPQDAHSPGVVKRLKEIALELKDVDNKVIHDNLGINEVAFRKIITKDPERWQSLQDSVMKTTENPGGTGLTEDKKKRLQELREKAKAGTLK